MIASASEHLEMRWLPVVDGSGRTRMEATWITMTAASITAGQNAAHAA